MQAYLARNEEQINGQGETVEIYESILTKSKNNQCRPPAGQIGFLSAVVLREPLNSFIEIVENRKRDNLIDAIKGRTMPGTQFLA